MAFLKTNRKRTTKDGSDSTSNKGSVSIRLIKSTRHIWRVLSRGEAKFPKKLPRGGSQTCTVASKRTECPPFDSMYKLSINVGRIVHSLFTRLNSDFFSSLARVLVMIVLGFDQASHHERLHSFLRPY